MARQFNGSSDRGSNSDALSGVSTAGNFTISVWVYVDSATAGSHGILNAGGAVSYSAQIRRDGSAWNLYVLDGAGSNINATMAGGVTAGVWTHLAGTYDGANIKLYVNGTLQQTTANTTRSQNGSNNHLGVERDDVSAFWNGRIAELGLWDSDIGQAEITKLAGAVSADLAISGSMTTKAKDYWNLYGSNSPELNSGSLADGFVWTLTGTSQLAGPFSVIPFVLPPYMAY